MAYWLWRLPVSKLMDVGYTLSGEVRAVVRFYFRTSFYSIGCTNGFYKCKLQRIGKTSNNGNRPENGNVMDLAGSGIIKLGELWLI